MQHSSKKIEKLYRASLLQFIIVLLPLILLAINLHQLLSQINNNRDQQPTQTINTNTQTIKHLPNFSLFGDYNAKAQSIEKTHLNLILEGLVFDSNPQSSFAIISQNHQPSHIYKVGDAVLDGVKIAHIYPDHLVLQHSNHLESLTFPLQKLSNNLQHSARTFSSINNKPYQNPSKLPQHLGNIHAS